MNCTEINVVPAVPRATMRLQLSDQLRFDDALALLPYLQSLGISHLFVSPIMTAAPGSQHGYDVVDHARVSEALGGEAGLRRLVRGLRQHGMGLIVDVVPNHMAIDDAGNQRWQEVLTWGRASENADFFDIDWDVNDPVLRNRVLLPLLGRSYGEALAAGELSLRFDAANGRFDVAYFEHRFPLAPHSYAALLQQAGLDDLGRKFARGSGPRARAPMHRHFEQACAELAAQSAGSEAAIEALLQRYNGSEQASRERMHRLLEAQHYRLAWWRTAADEINWRRFFDINTLAAVRVERPEVFEAVHAVIFRLYAEGLIDGLRIDHVDGLVDPRAYCRQLRARLEMLRRQRPPDAPSAPAYIVVEKILAPGERLARDWRVDGTSGYSFMNDVAALMHDPRGEDALSRQWRSYSGGNDFDSEARAARRRIALDLFPSAFNACAHALHVIARSDTRWRDWTLAAIRRVLVEILVHFPVYRTYVDARGRSAADADIMRRVIAQARETCRPGERPLVDLIDRWLGGEAPRQPKGADARRSRLRALARFQQLTSPVAAKAVEDTAYYRHGRLLSRNEVGADPAQFSLSLTDFHRHNRRRRQRYPRAMLATATHDHKRGEDVRARLSVLSEMPQRWASAVEHWSRLNASVRAADHAPDNTDEYILYQMMVGCWPLDLRLDDAEGMAGFHQRLQQWQGKAVREAKRHSGWLDPNPEYEEGCADFLRYLMIEPRGERFRHAMQAFVDLVAAPGAIKGLAQTLLRTTVPGVPDLYQGTDGWDFSMVDPDNRRAVDFDSRSAALKASEDDATLMANWRDGRIKQRLIARSLQLRARLPEIFAHGRYQPLRVTGPHADGFVAFARCDARDAVLVLAPRFTGAWVDGPERLGFRTDSLRDHRLLLPHALRERTWQSHLDLALPVQTDDGALEIETLMRRWPVALLSSAGLS